MNGNETDRPAYLEKGYKVTYEVECDDRKGKYAVSECDDS